MSSFSLRRILKLLVVLAVAAVLGLPASHAAPPNLLLITVDTLRPDALGWVAGRNETPEIDRLATEGFRFPAAISPAPLTLPAHASILTGLIPPRHGARENGRVIGSSTPLLAEILSAAGYETLAFVSGYPLKARFGLARGFDHYDDEVSEGEGAWLERRADATTDAALERMRSVDGPWFLWVHYYDPHLPYDPPTGPANDEARGFYDGEVVFVDREIAELRRGLAEMSKDRETLTVFTADHGESLGEHGEGTHGFFIYDSTVRVPLIFHWPGRVRPGESSMPARLVDVLPTILDLLGKAAPKEIDGVELTPILRGRSQEIPPAYAETLQPWTSYGWAPLRSVTQGDWKLIEAPRPELYDLAGDPGEVRNLVTEERSQARSLKAELEAIAALPTTESISVDDAQTLAALRALGYAGAGSSSSEIPWRGLPDPKDRVELRELLTEADELLRGGDPVGALKKFDAVLAKEANNRFAASRSGEALLQMNDLPRAIERLRRAAKLDPERPEIRGLLAGALMRANRPKEAIDEWMELIRLDPGAAGAWSNLGAALGRAGRAGDAAEAYAEAVRLEPDNPDRLIRSAFAEHGAGRIEEAVRKLQKAFQLTGEERFPHSGALGILLARLGRGDEAHAHLARSRPQEGDFAAARVELARLELAAGRREAARRALQEALVAAPELRGSIAGDPRLAPLLGSSNRP